MTNEEILIQIKDRLALENFNKPFWMLLNSEQCSHLVDLVAIQYAMEILDNTFSHYKINTP